MQVWCQFNELGRIITGYTEKQGGKTMKDFYYGSLATLPDVWKNATPANQVL